MSDTYVFDGPTARRLIAMLHAFEASGGALFNQPSANGLILPTTLFACVLTEDVTGGEAEATLKTWSPSGDGSYSNSAETITAVDTLGIFNDGASGNEGLGRILASANGPVYELWQLHC